MRFLVFSIAVLVAFNSISFSQEKKKEKDRPRLFQGGLIKRFEDLQEKMRKDREARQKKREEDAKKLAERLLKDKRDATEKNAQNNSRRISDSNSLLDPYAPNRNLAPQNSSRRNPNLPSLPRINPQPDVAPAETILSGSRPKVTLGVDVKPTGIATAGLNVEKVVPSGPAAAGGIQVNDRIVSVGGSTIKKIEDLDLILSAFEPGDRTEIEVIRKNKKKKLLVDFPSDGKSRSPAGLATPNGLGNPGGLSSRSGLANNSRSNTEELPGPGNANKPNGLSPPVLPLLEGPGNQVNRNPVNPNGARSMETGKQEVRAGIGVTAVAVDPTIFAQQNLSVRQGAFLDGIQKDSAADKAGLKMGDVVIAVDGRKVDSAMSMAELIQSYKPGDKAQLLYYRQNRLKRTEIKMDAIPVSELERYAAQPNPNQYRSEQPQTPKQNSILGGLGDDFPRLKKVENLIDRFSLNPREDRNDTAPSARRGSGNNREVELQNEVQTLRNRLRGQDRQIKDLTEKLTLIEKMLSERQADKGGNNKK